MTPPIDLTPEQGDLLAWYMARFVPDPERGYALMNPAGATYKYTRKHEPLTPERLTLALTGTPARRLKIDDTWGSHPYSLAVVPQHRDGWALNAVIDVDSGGTPALYNALRTCADHGLWAFAQIGNSNEHAGGHVYIPGAHTAPASMLRDLAERIQAAAKLDGEAYPKSADLRLPLMLHLRAPGGPQRFPLLLPNGDLIPATDAWTALATLRQQWQANSPERTTAALGTLPTLTVETRQPLHKSKVNPFNGGSVIRWYNDNHTVTELLETLGVDTGKGKGAVLCPWHDDHNPSLVLWTHHTTGQTVCRCYSKHSNCPASSVAYLDAFNVCCLIESLSPSEAVGHLAEKYGLGRKREYQARETVTTPADPTTDPIETHRAAISKARDQLAHAMQTAAQQQGTVTVIRATPGLGKTHTAAALANDLHAQGKTVVVAVPSHQLATLEWATRLRDPFIWQPRLALCTCHDRQLLRHWGSLGYVLPKCNEDCPYRAQHDHAKGRIIVFQHNHLHLDGGRLLAGADVVIVDESPLGALLEEQTVSNEDLRRLANRLDDPTYPDPAVRLLRALYQVATAYGHRKAKPLQGKALIEALDNALGGTLWEAIVEAEASQHAQPHQIVDPASDPLSLPPVFFGRMLGALEHDAEAPGERNSLLAWAKTQDGWRWTWYERHPLLARHTDRLMKPAVIVLDGSANALVAQQMYAPWPVELVTIDAPLSPTVKVVQVPVAASTRRIAQDRRQLQWLVRNIAVVCEQLGTILDGGISYMATTDYFKSQLGGTWLHYGGQRGSNELATARTLALIASPTAPPDAIERKARALWKDDTPIDTTWDRVGTGDYRARDARLDAMSQLHGPEELRQAAHRCRPILSDEPTTLLIFSTWDLDALGIAPTLTVDQLPHGRSTAATEALNTYLERLGKADRGGESKASGPATAIKSPISKVNKYSTSHPTFENGRFIADRGDTPPPISSSPNGGGRRLMDEQATADQAQVRMLERIRAGDWASAFRLAGAIEPTQRVGSALADVTWLVQAVRMRRHSHHGAVVQVAAS